jgi:hypothetical protein
MDSIAATELGPRVNFARLLLRGGGCGASTANKVAPAPGLLVALGTESTATPVRGKIHESMSGSVKSGDVLIGEAKRGGRIELYFTNAGMPHPTSHSTRRAGASTPNLSRTASAPFHCW